MDHFSAGRKRVKSGLILMAFFFMLFLAFSHLAFAENSGHGEAHAAPVKTWEATDWARVLNFAILAGVLFMIARKPVSKMFNDRIAGIKEQLAELEGKKLEAEKQLAIYNEKLTQLGKEAETIVDEYVRQGNEARERILKEAKSNAEKLEEKALKNIEHEFKQARLKLQAEITEKALARAEAKIMGGISSEDQNRLVDEYLEKVVA